MEDPPCRTASPSVWPAPRSKLSPLLALLLVSSVLTASVVATLKSGASTTALSLSGTSASLSESGPTRHLRVRDGVVTSDGGSFGVYLATPNDDDRVEWCDPKCCSRHFGVDHEAHRSLETEVSSACKEEGNDWITAVPTAVQYLMIIFLVSLSALFSGLTLGLMSLDKTGLEIVMEGDDPDLAEAARKIYPVRSNGNLLLCTLLLGNVAVNALLSIVLAERFGGTVGFVASTAVIVIFGEIIPQALCSRYALQIGRRTVPLVRVIMILFWPIAAPLAFCLDKLLGHEIGTTYSKSEMLKLLEIHVSQGRFDKETGTAMTGALTYKDIAVKDVMTPIENTFMLGIDDKLNFETIATVFKTGYSRIPVYEISVNNIVGILFVKDLIFIDPEDETPVRNFVQIFGRSALVVWPDDKLGDVLRELKQGRSHMALVRDVNNENDEQDPFYEIKGIITLEDIIEEILGDEIVDETDAFVDGTHSTKVNRMEKFDWGRLRLLDDRIVDQALSADEVKAVTAHLRTNHSSAVELLSDKQLCRLVAETSVTELPTAEQEIGEDVPRDLIYEKGVAIDTCTLILGGKVTVLAGADSFRSDVSSWAVLAASALTNPSYTPDFSAYVSSGPCRCLKFTRAAFTSAVDASTVERVATRHGEPLSPENHSAGVIDVSANGSQGVKKDRDVGGNGGVHHDSGLDGEHGERRTKERAAFRSRRIQLLAAFQNNGHGLRQKDESRQETNNFVDGVDADGIEKPPEDVPSPPRTGSFEMSPLQVQLTGGGNYVPRPQNSRSTTEGSTRTTDRSDGSSMDYVCGRDVTGKEPRNNE